MRNVVYVNMRACRIEWRFLKPKSRTQNKSIPFYSKTVFFVRMPFIRTKNTVSPRQRCDTLHNQTLHGRKSVRADRHFRADDEAIRAKIAIFDKPLSFTALPCRTPVESLFVERRWQ